MKNGDKAMDGYAVIWNAEFLDGNIHKSPEMTQGDSDFCFLAWQGKISSG